MGDEPKMFVGADWGTSRLRVRLVEPQGDGWKVRAESTSDDGVGVLSRRAPTGTARSRLYEETLTHHLTRVRRDAGVVEELPVVISGMASSSLGWRELPYARLPFDLAGGTAVMEPASLVPGAAAVWIVSGVRALNDIMRGEETELVGWCSMQRDAAVWQDGWVLLPGTHCKHARVQAGKLVDFHTAMTGELFAVLSEHSVLRASLEADGEAEPEEFNAGVRLGRTGGLASTLFQVRTRQVLHGKGGAGNRDFLSGVLIGAELVELEREGADGPPILVTGEGPLSARYREAVRKMGIGSRLINATSPDVGAATVAGQARLLAAHRRPGSPLQLGKS